MMSSVRLHVMMPQRQDDQLRGLEQATGLNRSDLVRRFVDHCSQPHVLNLMFPTLSGHMNNVATARQ